MSTVTEIREAISQLKTEDRHLLLAELIATWQEPNDNDPELVAALEQGLADDEAGLVHSLDEVRAMIPQWITKSPSPKTP
ncbi:MAG TPA: hypothetical protein VGC39_11205 [Candidatus Methylacidiphilales bacterium]